MKHFLLSIVFMSAGVFANPFDVKENLQKINQDQDVLLSTLKKMAEKKEAQGVEVKNSRVRVREEKIQIVQAKAAQDRIKKAEELTAKKERKEAQKVRKFKSAKLRAKNAIVNIDIVQEEKMAKREADKAYLEAIKEMH